MARPALTHVGHDGAPAMVDVSAKAVTPRAAVARGHVTVSGVARRLVRTGAVAKGDPLNVARVAGIQAAKRTSALIPLCHPLLVGAVLVNFRIEDTWVEVEAAVDTVDRTGVETEALHACAIAGLTIYDMCKSADRGMVIGEVALWEKTGGRSGTYRRSANVASVVTKVVES